MTTRTNLEIFSGIGVDDEKEVVVDSSLINTSTDFPTDSTNNANVNILSESLPIADNSLTVEHYGEAESQKGRAFAGGLTFQFADELEAFAISLKDDGVSYEQAKAEINKKVAAYYQQNPKEAFGMELAGAFLPTVISLFGSPAAWGTTVSNIFRLGRSVFQSGSKTSKLSVAQTMNRSGIGAGTYSVGAAENKGVGDFATGYIIGAPIAGGFVLGGNVISGIATYVNALSKRMGNTASLAVRKELNKLMELTGKTEDQVVVDLMNGRLLTENATLVELIKQTVKGKGTAQDILEDSAKMRPGKTKTDVINEMQLAQTGTKSDTNLTKVWNQSQAQIKKKENKLYETAFKDKNKRDIHLVKGQADNVVNDLLAAAQMKGTGVFDELEKIYSSSKSLVPLFTKDANGAIRMLRQPTLRDAEVIRRTLDEIAYDLNISGKGQAGSNIQALALDIRTKLDKFSPKLKSVRKKAHIVRKGREAYEYGLGLINAKKGNAPEDVQVFIDEFGKLPGVMNALRIGITQALKNKEGSGAIKKLADEDKNLYGIITQVLSKEQLATIMPKLQVAANAAKVSPSLQGSFGSQTADKIQMSRIAGASGGREGGLTVAIFDGAIQYMKRNMGLSAKHAKEYAEIITTNPENYKKLEKALIEDSSMDTFMKLLDSMITGVAATYGDLRAKTGATEVNEHFDPVGSSGIEGLMGLLGKKAFPMITGFQE
jgi:hypothetical protein